MTACTDTQIKYTGNGVTTKFSFPFTYMHFYDVQAALWDDSKREYIVQSNLYVLSDATTVEFLTPPPSPPASTPNGLNVLIFRITDLDESDTTFYPGSSIRAKDLNSNFDQLRLSVQEARCGLESEREDVTNKVWNRDGIKGRDDIQTPQSPYDTMYRNDQIAGRWYGDTSGNREDQEAVATTGAISERLDPYVQGGLPGETEEGFGHQEGKWWINTEDCWQSWWNPEAGAWVAYANTGPRGATGAEGAEGPQGPPGNPLVIKGTLPAGEWVEPDPKEIGDVWISEGEITNFPGGGTPQADDALVWQGERWINLGPIGIQGKKGDKGDKGDQGPIGPTGPEGSQGIQGEEGDKGNPGLGVNYKGQVATKEDLPSDAQANDGWQALDTMHLWVWNGSVWLDAGPISAGPAGPMGPVMDISTLPPLPAL